MLGAGRLARPASFSEAAKWDRRRVGSWRASAPPITWLATIVGASIGIALSPDDGQGVNVLLSRSDQALYQAKVGRGGYAFAGDLQGARRDAEKPARQQRAA
ncbi:diguanylate cyclase domain-containing protein [Bradyrhizobium sp.]|uniref:diguanylate cyclase domain-containing protein n=1 Tax=Bradyrhizobium sp. TaxID=376 RepID=UPI003C6EC4E8